MRWTEGWFLVALLVTIAIGVLIDARRRRSCDCGDPADQSMHYQTCPRYRRISPRRAADALTREAEEDGFYDD